MPPPNTDGVNMAPIPRSSQTRGLFGPRSTARSIALDDFGPSVIPRSGFDPMSCPITDDRTACDSAS
jgi:hypothetical protein